MAQSKYMLATYNPKPGRVNKHRIISDYVLTTCSWKSSRVNEHRVNLMTDSHAGSIDTGLT